MKLTAIFLLLCFNLCAATWHAVINSDSLFTFLDTRIIQTNGETHYLAIYRVGEVDAGDISSRSYINVWFDSQSVAIVWLVQDTTDLSVPIPSLSDAWSIVESVTPFTHAIWDAQNIDPSAPYRHLENWDWPNYVNGITVTSYTEGCDVWAYFDSSGLPLITQCVAPFAPKHGLSKGHNKQPLPTTK